ncbi:unnamed protein product [Polarella glacialis]|uniref:Uncharacterized protein n=1 Tax=Polarella glacialis TaxID=89957 RepID=A0A813IUC7_POLGL|nr:unnamed protein product [Polarella glacialis]
MAQGLQGNSFSVINNAAISILVLVGALTLIAGAVDFYCHRRYAMASDRPRFWVVTLMGLSYAVLIPGLFTTLFSFYIGAVGAIELKSFTDNMMSFAKLLADTGGWFGCILVLSFSVFVPVLKVVLMVLSEAWRHKEDERRRIWSRRMMLFVKAISKWACPDIFAYILMLYLVRSLEKPPTLNGRMRLDIGFLCSSVFSLGTTIASLGVRMPPPIESHAKSHQSQKVPFLGFWVALLFLGFAALLGTGITEPSMSLRLDMNAVYNNPLVAEDMQDFVAALDLPSLANADVSIANCLEALGGWIRYGEVTSFVSWVMIAFFVVALTIVDMVVLLIIALKVQFGKDDPNLVHWKTAAGMLKNTSMLDGYIVGVAVVVFSGKIYEAEGLILGMENGLALLLGAELCHYAAFFLVTGCLRCDNWRAEALPSPEAEVHPLTPTAEEIGKQVSESDFGPTGDDLKAVEYVAEQFKSSSDVAILP